MSNPRGHDPATDSPDAPRISVVIPVYCATDDHRLFLVEAIESVARQTYRDFEVLIIDDASPMDIRPVVESNTGLSQTRLIRNHRNLGHAETRNLGIREARGDLVAFLDHDDIWLPEKLERQAGMMDAHSEAAMVFCDMEVFGPHSNRLRIDQSIIPERPGFCWFVSHGNYTISASSVMVRRQALIDIGLFDSRYSTCDDFDAWLKIAMDAPIFHIPETLAKYRLHEANVNYSVDRLNDNVLLTRLIWRYWRTASLVEKLLLLPRLARKLVGRAYFSLRRNRRFVD